MTNKGVANLTKHYGNLELTGYYTASSRQAGDLAINLSLTTIQNKIYCCFTYTKALLSVKRAKNLVDIFFQLIDSLKG